ncbi:uncharacterized protein [Coffea arabica]|uniref:DNA-binding protein SMUBP-2-like n=1 Tax=Coffea arabica TaxID=13443 RepID=A0ABM4WPF5_COFAR
MAIYGTLKSSYNSMCYYASYMDDEFNKLQQMFDKHSVQLKEKCIDREYGGDGFVMDSRVMTDRSRRTFEVLDLKESRAKGDHKQAEAKKKRKCGHCKYKPKSTNDLTCNELVEDCRMNLRGETNSSIQLGYLTKMERSMFKNMDAGEDGCSITVALESRYGDPTFSKLFGKSIRIDRIQGLADAVTYERNCEALMMLQKKGLQKRNPSIAVVTTLFGDSEVVRLLEENHLVDWTEVELNGLLDSKSYDVSQRRAIALGLNRKRPVLIIQGPPGTGKTGLLKELIPLAVKQGERVLVTAPTNSAVDNMVEKLCDSGIKIVRVGNPVRISQAVASRSLVQIVNAKLADFQAEIERKKSNLRKDLKHCLKDDSLAAGIRQLLKQLGKTMKKKEKETVREILSSAQVVLATNTGAADPLIRRLDTFDLVVIDEAGQAIEPSCWIPILLGKRCILAGDQCQLAPVILSRKAAEGGLGISLLERAASLHKGIMVTRLTVQYRMNNAIASWASKEMYGGLLKSSSSVSSHLLVDSPFVKPTWITKCPLLLLDTRMPHGSLSIGIRACCAVRVVWNSEANRGRHYYPRVNSSVN